MDEKAVAAMWVRMEVRPGRLVVGTTRSQLLLGEPQAPGDELRRFSGANGKAGLRTPLTRPAPGSAPAPRVTRAAEARSCPASGSAPERVARAEVSG